jgi:drug/metabolite transporter (DMT)-like permease
VNITPITTALFSIFLSASGQLALKHGTKGVGPVAAGDLAGRLPEILGNPFILLGFALYGLGAVLWVSAISELDLSFAYPLVSLSFVLVVAASVLLFKEQPRANHLIGCAVIIIGIWILAWRR